jgi:diguanylate cyclase (GGDEF)-like protein
MAGAMLLNVAGEIWFAVLTLRDDQGWPSPAHVFYLSAYGVLAYGVLALDRQRGHRPDFGARLEAGIVAGAVALLALVYLIGPLVTDSGQSAAARVVGTLDPLVDVLLVFLMARMLIGPRRQTAAIWWLELGLALTVSADVVGSIIVLTTGRAGFPHWLDLPWLLFYGLIGWAALSAAQGPDEGAELLVQTGLTVGRLVVLGVAAVLPSVVQVVLAANGHPQDGAYLGAGSLVLLLMVMARIWDLLQQVRRQSDQMAQMARTDPLTGVANRRSWDFELARGMAAASQAGSVLLVALLDLDFFKKYNDAHGHQAGDDLLKEAARMWSLGVGPGGRIARWGGEEFAVTLHCTEVASGLGVLDGLRALVPFGATCSIGVARWDGTQDAAALLHVADEALYEAKRTGRDRLVFSSQTDAQLPDPKQGVA